MAAAAAFCVESCSFLDVVPVETPGPEDFLLTSEDALQYLYGCYGTLIDKNVKVLSYNTLAMGSDEFVGCETVYDNFRRQQCNQITGLNVASHGGVWGVYCKGIGYCNKFMDDLASTDVPELTVEDRTTYIAEAKFLKAYYHYKLMSACGPVPIMDRQLPMSTKKEDLPGRSHFDACVEYVVALCDEVYPDLKDNFNANLRSYGRATKVACKMLKAKVLLLAASPLWNGSFPSRGWINPNYETPGYGKELVSYKYDEEKWRRAKKACMEAILEAEAEGHRLFDLDVSEGLRQEAGIPLPKLPVSDENAREEIARRTMLMRFLPVTPPNQGNKEILWGTLWQTNEIDYASIPHYVLTDVTGQARGGWGMVNPTLYTVEHFFTRNGKLPSEDPLFPRESDWFRRAGFSGTQENVINLCANREPRFYACISFDGDEYSPVIANGTSLHVDALNPNENAYNPDKFGMNNNTRTGFWNKKNVHPNIRYDQWGGENVGAMNDHPWAIFRLGDLYLMYAEACAHLGDAGEGLPYLNSIRRRAGVPEYTAAEVADKDVFLRKVMDERFAELYMEGMRLEDIRRYVDGNARMSYSCYQGLNALDLTPSFDEFNVRTQIDQQFTWNNRMYLQPVPDAEVYANPQLVQAPYY